MECNISQRCTKKKVQQTRQQNWQRPCHVRQTIKTAGKRRGTQAGRHNHWQIQR